MKHIALGPVLLLCFCCESLQAQHAAAKGPASAAVMEAVIYKELFAGINLSPGDEQKAKAIIAAEQAAQEAIVVGSPDLWNRRVRLNHERDSTLTALLRSPQDKARFQSNALPGRLSPKAWPQKKRVIALPLPLETRMFLRS